MTLLTKCMKFHLKTTKSKSIYIKNCLKLNLLNYKIITDLFYLYFTLFFHRKSINFKQQFSTII